MRQANLKITHFVLEFFGCESSLSNARFISAALHRAIKQTKMTKLHSYSHSFQPSGVTSVIVLKESHLSIHTWPEYNYAAIDLFTCGKKEDAAHALRSLVENLKPRRVKHQEIRRGTGR
ncbi:MAG: adenosylmethionine decarboxylase [Deltaproteobacteria bacterium]|nr:adenosylmethionine decarboxylase [Deltaproteobacteria bacterium]